MSNQEIKHSLQNWQAIVKKYQKPSNRKAVIQILNSFLPYIGLWALIYWTIQWSYLLTILLVIVTAFFLVRIFIIQHDCGHFSFLKSRKMNHAIGLFCSFFSTIPFKYWAHVHSFHHGHNGQFEHRDLGDINFLTTEEYAKLPRWRKFFYRLFRSPIVMFFISPFIYITVSNRFPFIWLKGWSKVIRAQIYNNIFLILVYGLLAYFLGWKTFLIIQLSIVYVFGIIAFWFFYIQHQHDEGYKSWKVNWDYLIASIKGSTYYKLPKVFHWLTGNIGFHHIHHLSSRIPNYNLAKCAKENPILNEYATKVTFWQSLKYMNNKLWDERRKRMISFSEYYRTYKQKAS